MFCGTSIDLHTSQVRTHVQYNLVLRPVHVAGKQLISKHSKNTETR